MVQGQSQPKEDDTVRTPYLLCAAESLRFTTRLEYKFIYTFLEIVTVLQLILHAISTDLSVHMWLIPMNPCSAKLECIAAVVGRPSSSADAISSFEQKHSMAGDR